MGFNSVFKGLISSILTGSITASAFSDWFQHTATRTCGW